ncbi:hypothetical protein [Cohnella thailandensis]|uniref:Copper amine oxidase n=1 Tax=Cohnella thailandensis TaxID=557557 RepID=A0A841SWN9_9BACL|nr:hypothetical protein [Cohnella thailandensis]MBB6636334.1 hypothetical protein [Cohnella thailandensis]MBP1973696.1 hypothetical protein [Cohnella thailandensis]
MAKLKTLTTVGALFGIMTFAAHTGAEGDLVPVATLKPALSMDKPVLTPVGGKLIFSDDPEPFTRPGAFYRDSAEGEFRVFWHHQNQGDSEATVAVAVTNTSQETVKLFSKGQGVSTSLYVTEAGQLSLAEFLKTYGRTKSLALLAPGESYFLDAPTGAGQTTSGLAQFEARTQRGNSPAEVQVTVLNYETKPDHPEEAPVLPARGPQVRGTFPHFDRIGTLTYHTSMGNAYLPIDSAASGKWKDDMPGEYEKGWNAVDGKEVINNGNYGVLYHWTFDYINDDGGPKTIKMYLNPPGGSGNYTLQWKNEILNSGWLSYVNAWNFKTFTLGAGEREIKVQTSLVGGSAGAQNLYFTNEPRNG